MRRVFLLSLLLAALTCLIVWCAVRLSGTAPETPAGTDAATIITVREGDTVRTAALSDWLVGVVAAEMPASFEPEALRAQAVAARTYILDHASARKAAHPDADVCDDPACCTAWRSDEAMEEAWGADAPSFRARIAAAVADTDGEVLTYDGAPIRAVFHASSAGQTESSAAIWGAQPYLISVSTPETEADVPNFVTVVSFTPDELRAAVSSTYPDCVFPDDPAAWLSAPELDAAGRVASQAIGSVRLSGRELRSLLGLRSTVFESAYVDGVFRFTVTGSGHGVGMSQYGANVMAQQGSGYAEILAHYYPGTELCKLNGQ